MKHAMGNAQSLINDRTRVIEDHEGDLWFGTSNGISLLLIQKQVSGIHF